jgi:dTDP-4-dehydrorhamnose reductase
MRILIFGRTGQVARALGAIQWPDGWIVAAFGRDRCNLAVSGAAAAAIRDFDPAIVVNAAAYTAVDRAEADRPAAFAVNESAVREMAAATAERGRTLIHLSTDYVFDGRAAAPYVESDRCNPLSVYGASKLAGEIAIRELQPRHIILRTSWVFSPHGSNFVRTMLRLGAERDEVRIVGDQRGGPTEADDIAHAIAAITQGLAAGSTAFGAYHFAGTPAVSWYEFALAIFNRAAARGARVPGMITQIGVGDYPTAALRPANSRLNCDAVARDWGLTQPSWEAALDRCLDAMLQTRDRSVAA